ncbi:MAG: biotin synthase BioB [Selenomonadaceae bacterium]
MTNQLNPKQLAQNIIDGRRLGRGEDLSFLLTCDLEKLQQGADMLRRHFCGDHVDLCTIINGRSGRCSEDCAYCAQSAKYHTGIDEYDSLSPAEILANAQLNEREGVHRFAIVTSGRSLCGQAFEEVLATFRTLQENCAFGLCASHGFLSAKQFSQLVEAGVTSYHHNIETSRRFFPQICSTHTYEDKIRTIRLAQQAGLCVCSGGIIGLGETWEDRLDMAISLAELGIKSIPINALMAIPGTQLEKQPPLPAADILRTIAFFRFINPEANIRLAAGRKLLPENGATAFLGGASASITGNMLTTSGTTIREDMALLKKLGFDTTPSNSSCSANRA